MKNAGLKELKKCHSQERFYVHVAAEIKDNFDNRLFKTAASGENDLLSYWLNMDDEDCVR